MRTLTPSPDSPSTFYAFDNDETLTVIEKKNGVVEMRTVQVDGMNHDGCQDYYPLYLSSKAGSILADQIPWCCSSPYTTYCYAFNTHTEDSNNGVLVYKSLEDNVLYFTTLIQVGNRCNMSNYRITGEQSLRLDHVEECYGHFVPVQSASSTFRGNSTYVTSNLLNDNSLHIRWENGTDESSFSVYSFTSSPIHLDQLLLQYKDEQTMVGAVGRLGSIDWKDEGGITLTTPIRALPSLLRHSQRSFLRCSE
ncbi:hypothetical protein PMAYCL1PPCAC_07042 [Pristionchus mayeri]|uniref:Uncharacterized protein n=1 Tax=Pristionchus mayeri TaxID=1317129 RepID=A0AAN4Z973_9BILA|nr:hypothetical protein PMAYCL1PPCAC_07042 [Pristionchus mayeri]